MQIDATTFYELLTLVSRNNTEKTKVLADTLFGLYDDIVSSLSSNDVNYCNLYISISKELISQQLSIDTNKADITNIIQRYLNNVIFKRDKTIKDILREMINNQVSPTRLADISKKLSNIVIWYKSKNYVTKLYSLLHSCKLSYDLGEQEDKLLEMKDTINDLKHEIVDIDSVIGRSGAVELIDFSNKNTIKAAYDLYQERQVAHVLKTGIQGLNRMCGPRGGFALGESVLFCALMHNFKSGMLINIARWIATYNTPPPSAKKPMILFITLENIGYMNMIEMFKQMYVTLNGVEPSEDMPSDVMVDSIYEYFNKSPYTFVIERYLPSTFGYDEMVRLMEKYENSGFRIVATIIDYLSQMKMPGNGWSQDHSLIQSHFNKVCNYFKAVGTTLFTSAQLNRAASDIVGTGCPHPVKHFSERHMAGSHGITREVDFVCYMHIERDEQGNSWLTMNWGKHRYVNNTPESHKFIAYKFEPYGIPDDIDGEFKGVKNIYAVKKDTESSENIDDLLSNITV